MSFGGKKMKTCYNCQKYPLCRTMTDIMKVISRDMTIKAESEIMIVMAETCTYFKEKEK
jgi:hypothetical protein